MMTCNSLPFLVLDLLKTTCGRPEEEVEVEVEEVLGKQSQPKKERKKENA